MYKHTYVGNNVHKSLQYISEVYTGSSRLDILFLDSISFGLHVGVKQVTSMCGLTGEMSNWQQGILEILLVKSYFDSMLVSRELSN